MSLKELEIKCTNPSCGHVWNPRTSAPKKCPKCGWAAPKFETKFMTRKQLWQTWIIHVVAGVFVFFLGAAASYGFRDFTGTLLGFTGMLFFFVLGNRYWVEYRLYNLLHRPEG